MNTLEAQLGRITDSKTADFIRNGRDYKHDFFLTNKRRKEIVDGIKAGAIASALGFLLWNPLTDIYVNSQVLGSHDVLSASVKSNPSTKNADSHKRSIESILPSAKASKLLAKEDIEARFENTTRYKAIISEAETRYNIPRGLLGGLIMWESNGIPTKRSGTGAVGLTMLTSIACRELEVNPNNREKPYHSIMNGARYLAWLHYEKDMSWINSIAKYEQGPYSGAKGATAYARRVLECANFYKQHINNSMRDTGDNADNATKSNNTSLDYKFVRRKSNGHDVFKVRITEPTTSRKIAENFNNYAERRFGDKYRQTHPGKVTDGKRNPLRGQIPDSVVVYINVPRS